MSKNARKRKEIKLKKKIPVLGKTEAEVMEERRRILKEALMKPQKGPGQKELLETVRKHWMGNLRHMNKWFVETEIEIDQKKREFKRPTVKGIKPIIDATAVSLARRKLGTAKKMIKVSKIEESLKRREELIRKGEITESDEEYRLLNGIMKKLKRLEDMKDYYEKKLR